MTHVRVLRIGFLAMILASLPAFAQIQRTFVSAASGSDANPCTRPLPCRNFAAAIAQTQSGGEVVVLDSGGYGTFLVTQAVNIEAPAGVFAGVSVFPASAPGIMVIAGSSDSVILRGLTINGVGGDDGIRFTSGRSLHIERCAVSRMNNNGIDDLETGVLIVKDTKIVSCAQGIQTGNGTQVVRGVIDHTTVEDCTTGIGMYQGSRAIIRDSVITGKANGTGVGVFVLSSTVSLPSDVIIENSTISGFLYGIGASGSGGAPVIARVSNSTITHNTTGLLNDPVTGPIRSRLNNTLRDNGTDGSFNGSFPAN
jgi:parallel beta helix pectate lyase-like protein